MAERYFKKRYKKKTPAMRAAVDRAIERLDENRFHPGLGSRKVQATDGVWEARIDGGNRITYHLEGEVIVLRNNCHHDIVDQRP